MGWFATIEKKKSSQQQNNGHVPRTAQQHCLTAGRRGAERKRDGVMALGFLRGAKSSWRAHGARAVHRWFLQPSMDRRPRDPAEGQGRRPGGGPQACLEAAACLWFVSRPEHAHASTPHDQLCETRRSTLQPAFPSCHVCARKARRASPVGTRTAPVLRGRAGGHAGIPNMRVSMQAVSRVFQQLLIWNALEHDAFQVCVADSGFVPVDANTREWEHDQFCVVLVFQLERGRLS